MTNDLARHPSARHHSRPAIRTLRRRARLLYYTKDSLSSEKKYVNPLFCLRKNYNNDYTRQNRQSPTSSSPFLLRVFDRTHHLVIRTTLCRLKNYFLSYYVSHIYSIKLICQDNSELLILNKGAGYPLFLKGKKLDIGELAQMVERPLSMREVPGSIPGFSNSDSFVYSLEKACLVKC